MSLCDDCDNEDCDLVLTGETESCDDYLVLTETDTEDDDEPPFEDTESENDGDMEGTGDDDDDSYNDSMGEHGALQEEF